MTHVIFCGFSSCVLCDFIEVKDLEETESGGKEVSPDISVCITADQKERKSQEEDRKENANQVPNQTKNPQTIRNKEKKKEIFSANTCFLKNTVCVWKTQSCLSAVLFKELCLVFHASLRKHVKVSPVAFGQGLTSTEVFH